MEGYNRRLQRKGDGARTMKARFCCLRQERVKGCIRVTEAGSRPGRHELKSAETGVRGVLAQFPCDLQEGVYTALAFRFIAERGMVLSSFPESSRMMTKNPASAVLPFTPISR